MPFRSQAIDQAADFRACSPLRLYSHGQNGTANMELTVYFTIRTLGFNWMGNAEGSNEIKLLPIIDMGGAKIIMK